MIVLLDTSTPVCRVMLVDGDWRQTNEWQADRQLAKGLLKYVRDVLVQNNKTWNDIRGIGVFRGPGSFTGLRIGMTVCNTLADSLHVPIVGAEGDEWQVDALTKLEQGNDEKCVLPLYGSEARITQPRK